MSWLAISGRQLRREEGKEVSLIDLEKDEVEALAVQVRRGSED